MPDDSIAAQCDQRTNAGRLAQRYANDIFTMGQEFQASIAGFGVNKPARFVVGIADVVPRLIAFRLLEPVRSFRRAWPVHRSSSPLKAPRCDARSRIGLRRCHLDEPQGRVRSTRCDHSFRPPQAVRLNEVKIWQRRRVGLQPLHG